MILIDANLLLYAYDPFGRPVVGLKQRECQAVAVDAAA